MTFAAVVSALLPITYQNESPLWLPNRRLPYTTEVWPARTGSSSRGMSSGS
jgi:hypothetical protein